MARKAKDTSTDVVPANLQALADAALGEEAFVGPMPQVSVSPVSGAKATTLDLTGKELRLTEKTEKVLGINTRQGAGLKLGKGWYKEGPVQLSLRYQVIMKLLDNLGEAQFTADQFKSCLKGEKALLGSGTPASFLRAFIKDGYVEVA